jgi:hypothetical protein
LEVEENLVF